ncbi:hypothetical protein BDZ89DRAFT_1229737 [Hymenopellis radicata]|nr:hypothetical protein BDZ89DRAFT_1229737 [Hymenopellis radicata]
MKIRNFNAEPLLRTELASVVVPEPDPPSQWLKINDAGALAHKSTALRTLMSPDFDLNQHRSHDRLLRVRYYSSTGDGWDHSVLNLRHIPESRENIFCVGNIFATVVCVNDNEVCLALAQCTFIHTSVGSVVTAPLDEITLPESRFEISGQVLALSPHFEDDEVAWFWLADDFVEFETTKKKAENATSHVRNMKVTVNGGLVRPFTGQELEEAVIDVDDAPLEIRACHEFRPAQVTRR